MYFQPTGFEEVRATVPTGSPAPGKPSSFTWAPLVLGVFAMLYIRERRLFVLIKIKAKPRPQLQPQIDGWTRIFPRHRDAPATCSIPAPP